VEAVGGEIPRFFAKSWGAGNPARSRLFRWVNPVKSGSAVGKAAVQQVKSTTAGSRARLFFSTNGRQMRQAEGRSLRYSE